ncbi:MAG TPA: oligosaccharide flippase family protein [Thermodesulfobacteriota bacterium]|nr:oligosaccharide flippase family protein [Thermodesulfobacteriota bacterium]
MKRKLPGETDPDDRLHSNPDRTDQAIIDGHRESLSAHHQEMDQATLGKRARLGIVALVIRSLILQGAVFAGNIILARILSPSDFGIFGITQFVLAFFIFIGDAGLGGALVQRRNPPNQRELSSIFCFQILIALVVIATVWLGAPYILKLWPDLPDGSVMLLRVLSLGLLFTILKVIPSIQMERELLFGRLAAIEVIQSLVFYGFAVVLAFQGWGVWALVGSALIQMIVGAVTANFFRPWRPSLVLDRALIQPIVAFGIPYQFKNVVGFINSAVSPIYAGRILGTTGLGYINWAQTTGFLPVKIVEIIGRVSFPLFSRLHHDRAVFAETLGRSILICSLGTFFLAGFFCGLGPNLVRLVWSEKWLPAVPLLYVYATAITIGFVSPIVGAAFDAAGHPQIFARLAFGWTLLNWICVVYATPRWGITGFAVGYCLHVVLGNVALLILIRWVVPGTQVLKKIWPGALAGAGVFILSSFTASWVTSLGRLALIGLADFILFGIIMLPLNYQEVKAALSLLPSRTDEKP